MVRRPIRSDTDGARSTKAAGRSVGQRPSPRATINFSFPLLGAIATAPGSATPGMAGGSIRSQPDGTGTVTSPATIELAFTFLLELRCPITAPAAASPATAIPATAQNPYRLR